MQREQGKSTTYDLYDSPDLLYTYCDRLGQWIDSLGRIGGAHTSNSTQSSKTCVCRGYGEPEKNKNVEKFVLEHA